MKNHNNAEYGKQLILVTKYCELNDIPVSTYHALKAQGKGLEEIKIGRRCYTTLTFGSKWIETFIKS